MDARGQKHSEFDSHPNPQMKTCSKCNQTLSVDMFYRASRSTDGRQSACKKCADVASKVSGTRNPEKYKQNRVNYRTSLQAKLVAWRQEQGCQLCPEDDGTCLELHHPDPSTKEDDPSLIIRRYGWDAFLREASKCIVLCANCHRKVHAGRITLLPDKHCGDAPVS